MRFLLAILLPAIVLAQCTLPNGCGSEENAACYAAATVHPFKCSQCIGDGLCECIGTGPQACADCTDGLCVPDVANCPNNECYECTEGGCCDQFADGTNCANNNNANNVANDWSCLNGVCTACADTQSGANTDFNCNGAKPFCNEADEPNACYLCQNDQTGNATDAGCGGATPFCLAAQGGFGNECVPCINSDGASGTDDGCSAEFPYCVLTDRSQPALGNGGQQCIECVSDADCTGSCEKCIEGSCQLGLKSLGATCTRNSDCCGAAEGHATCFATSSGSYCVSCGCLAPPSTSKCVLQTSQCGFSGFDPMGCPYCELNPAGNNCRPKYAKLCGQFCGGNESGFTLASLCANFRAVTNGEQCWERVGVSIDETACPL